MCFIIRIALIASVLVNFCFAADNNNTQPSRKINRFGVGINLTGPMRNSSLFLDMYATPNIGLEINGVYLPKYFDNTNVAIAGIGCRYAFRGANPSARWSPYLGILPKIIYISATLQKTIHRTGYLYGVYMPFGIELIAFNGFSFATEIACDIVPGEFSASASTDSVRVHFPTIPIIGIKIGYHFRLGKKN